MHSIQQRLAESRERFKASHGVYPIVMRLGTELYKLVTDKPAWAIESTVVVEEKSIPAMAVVMVKPPEIRKAA